MTDGIYDLIIQKIYLFICVYKHLYVYDLYLYLSLVHYKNLNTIYGLRALNIETMFYLFLHMTQTPQRFFDLT